MATVSSAPQRRWLVLISMVCFQLEPPRLHWPRGLEHLLFHDRSIPVILPRDPRLALSLPDILGW